MSVTLGIPDVMMCVAAMLEGGRATIDAHLAVVDEGLQLAQVLDYFSKNVDVGMLPVLMLSAEDEAFQWVGIPETAEQAMHFSIWGMIHHDNERTRMHAIGRMGQAIRDVLNVKHKPFEVADGHSIFFESTCPVKQMSYGETRFSTAVCSAFVADFACRVRVVLHDTSP